MGVKRNPARRDDDHWNFGKYRLQYYIEDSLSVKNHFIIPIE